MKDQGRGGWTWFNDGAVGWKMLRMEMGHVLRTSAVLFAPHVLFGAVMQGTMELRIVGARMQWQYWSGFENSVRYVRLSELLDFIALKLSERNLKKAQWRRGFVEGRCGVEGSIRVEVSGGQLGSRRGDSPVEEQPDIWIATVSHGLTQAGIDAFWGPVWAAANARRHAEKSRMEEECIVWQRPAIVKRKKKFERKEKLSARWICRTWNINDYDSVVLIWVDIMVDHGLTVHERGHVISWDALVPFEVRKMEIRSWIIWLKSLLLVISCSNRDQ